MSEMAWLVVALAIAVYALGGWIVGGRVTAGLLARGSTKDDAAFLGVAAVVAWPLVLLGLAMLLANGDRKGSRHGK